MLIVHRSDSLAEFHLPRSGIELVVENMPFPCFSDSRGLSFLAICSVRRLLNRIHHIIYATGRTSAFAGPANVSTPATTGTEHSSPSSQAASMNNVCIELARQLDVWYHSLPDSIRPDLTRNYPRHLQEGWLRLRYWSAKHIIYRPCLIVAASAPNANDLPTFVLESSTMCVEACRNYIDTATYVLAQRTQYTWMTIQAYVALISIVTLSSPANTCLDPCRPCLSCASLLAVQFYDTLYLIYVTCS